MNIQAGMKGWSVFGANSPRSVKVLETGVRTIVVDAGGGVTFGIPRSSFYAVRADALAKLVADAERNVEAAEARRDALRMELRSERSKSEA